MSTPFDRVGAALIPASGLAALAAVRCHAGIAVILFGDRAWVTWPPGDAADWQPLLAVPGVAFFEKRDEHWYELGRHIPTFDLPPAGEAKLLDRVLFPAPLPAVAAPPVAESPVALRLVPSDRVHPTTAMRTTVATMQSWVDQATTRELASVRAARHGEQVLLRGERLPAIANAERFWGNGVLRPLGFRVEPDLPETAIRAAAAVSLNELLVLTADGAEAVPHEAFTPLTRAAARVALDG